MIVSLVLLVVFGKFMIILVVFLVVVFVVVLVFILVVVLMVILLVILLVFCTTMVIIAVLDRVVVFGLVGSQSWGNCCGHW